MHTVIHRAAVGRRLLTVAALAASLSITFAHAEDTTNHTKGILPLRNAPTLIAAQPPEQAAAAVTALRASLQHFVIQFAAPLSKTERIALERGGVQLQTYIGDNAFFARATERYAAATLEGFDKLFAVVPIERDWKLHRSFLTGDIPDWAILVTDPVEERDRQKAAETGADPASGKQSETWFASYVLFHKDVTLADAAKLVHSYGGIVQSELKTMNGLVVLLPPDGLYALVDEDSVQYAEPPLPPFSTVNAENRAITETDLVQAPPYNLDGSGVTVMVYDGGTLRTTHQDFSGRAVNGDSTGTSSHATHVAGTVGGDGTASGGANRGMAPGVNIVGYEFETAGPLVEGFLYTDPGDLEANYTDAIAIHGAQISNNSIGTNTARNGFDCDATGDYGITSGVIDGIVRGSVSGGEPFRVIWANGNERGSSRCGTSYVSTAPPAGAKNHITVGALSAITEEPASFTSWGPVDDGRIKPDISAPGVDVVSLNNTGDTAYTSKSGTSMASPTVCGIAALVMQDFRVNYPDQPDPRNSTLKVLFAHSAADETTGQDNRGPDFIYGYGSVRAPAVIELERSGNFLEAEVDQGEVFSFLVFVNPGDTELKVTLAWDDVPASPLVIPSLVNDLDLEVFDAANNQHFPWTLDPGNPSAPAVRTQPDHINNIEQVVIDAPAPGAYRVNIVGFNVPQGPQVFSVTATPQLINCSSQGVVSLDKRFYPCAATATVRVVDCDLNTDDKLVETVDVLVTSDSEPAGEVLTLTETAAESAAFEAVIPLSTSDAGGTLLIAPGDTVTATYDDLDSGAGKPAVATSEATVDCTAPVVSLVSVPTIEPRSAVITFETDEPSTVSVRYGTSCGALNEEIVGGLNTTHTMTVTSLIDQTDYFFAITATDRAGNSATFDDGGNCFTFTTPDIPDFFTQEFSTGFPLQNQSLLLVPNASVDGYTPCLTPIAALPTDPAGGTVLGLPDDNESISVNLPSQVSLYGTAYSQVFIGTNGYVTFTGTDTDSTETLADHFDTPRVSMLFDDLAPNEAGSLSYKIEADRFVVTWLNVTEDSTSNSNTFQLELFFDGSIQMSWLEIAVQDSIVGLSAGNGIDPDFMPSLLDSFDDCGPRPPSAGSQIVEVPEDRSVTITLLATDDGTPGPLTYTVDSLPTFELRDADNGVVIDAVPYTLANGGNQVIYQSNGGFNGDDSFTFFVDDGGTAPDGGTSNVATITARVLPVLDVPVRDDFAGPAFDADTWSVVEGATIDDLAINPPSGPNTARLNANADLIVTHLIDLSAAGGDVELLYQYQRTGGGDSPESGDDLLGEYVNDQGVWVEFQRHLGSGPDMTTFEQVELTLPADALHAAFRLRFSTSGSSGAFDDWFVDDLELKVLNAPEAQDVAVATASNFDVVIPLSGSDPNNDPLDYLILSLPANGVLVDPQGGAILAAPYTLIANGDEVEYEPDLGFLGIDTFAYQVTDGSFDSNVADVAVTVGGVESLIQFDLETDPGWAMTGGWDFGMPTGGGTHNGDPVGGFTGDNVYGYNLSGDYPNNLATTHYLTTSALDLAGITGSTLRFRRWLGVESSSFDHAQIQVSNNGTDWITIWEHEGPAINESAWSLQEYDISAVADNQAAVQIRWGLGPTDGSVTYPGWNIDDVEILGLRPVLAGDANCDGVISVGDINPFVLAITDRDAYQQQFPDCNLATADTNGDGQLSVGDINSFVLLVTGG